MLPVLQFLGFTLPVGPLFALLAFYVGGDLATRAVRWVSRDARADDWADAYSNAVFVALVAGLIGARLGYAARYASLYLADPRLLLSIRPGTLALGPGLVIAAAAALVYLRRRHVPLGVTADASALGLAGGLVVLNVGQFLTGDAYGVRTAVPWAVEMWGASRHPVQLYNAGALLLIGVLLWWHRRGALSGEIFWRFVMLSALAVLFLDAFRANPPTWGPGVRVAQVMALAGLLLAMYALSYYAGSRERESRAAASTELQIAGERS